MILTEKNCSTCRKTYEYYTSRLWFFNLLARRRTDTLCMLHILSTSVMLCCSFRNNLNSRNRKWVMLFFSIYATRDTTDITWPQPEETQMHSCVHFEKFFKKIHEIWFKCNYKLGSGMYQECNLQDKWQLNIIQCWHVCHVVWIARSWCS